VTDEGARAPQIRWRTQMKYMHFICVPHRKVGEYTEPFDSLSRTVVSQTLIEKDELFIGNVLDVIGHDLRM